MMKQGLGIILIAALALLLFLNLKGIPGSRLAPYLLRICPAADYIEIGRVRLDPWAGCIIEHIAVAKAYEQLKLSCQAEQVILSYNPSAWLRGKIGLQSVKVHNGALCLCPGDQPAALDSLAIDHIENTLYRKADTWYLDNLSADFLGLKINCRGQIQALDALGQMLPPAARNVETAWSDQLQSLVHSPTLQMLSFIQQLNGIKFAGRPHLDITFLFNAKDVCASAATIRMAGSATQAFELSLDQWGLQAEFKNNRLYLQQAYMQLPEQHLTCSGSYSCAEHLVDAHIGGRLLLKDWLKLLPAAWRAGVAEPLSALDGMLEGEVQLGPATLEQLGGHLSGHMALTQAKLKDIPIERAYLECAIQGNQIQVDPFYCALGRADPPGTLQGHIYYDANSGDYEGYAAAQLDPRIMAALLEPDLYELADRFAFEATPASCELDFGGNLNRLDALWMSGRVQGSNFTFRGTPISSFQSKLLYQNGILTLDKLRLLRPEGAVTGWLADNLTGTVSDFDLVSSADPKAVAQILDEDLVGYLDDFNFAGNMRIAARGRFDYGAGTLTDFKAEVAGEHWGSSYFQIDRYAFNASMRPQRCDLSEITGEAYQGAFSGQASFYQAAGNSNLQYEMAAQAKGMNLESILRSLGYQGSYKGRLDCECGLVGSIGPGQGATAQGGGALSIADGEFLQLRPLRPFSRLITSLDSEVGSINFTKCKANFIVKNSQINTRDAVLEGPAISIYASGYYAFNNYLDFIIWSQFSENHELLPEFKKALTPLSQLLACRLNGQVNNPQCWPLNLSREQTLALPKDILLNMPKDVLIGLPKDILVNLPKEVLASLPKELLIKLPYNTLIRLPKEVLAILPRELLLSLPKHLFITLPLDLRNKLAPEKP